MDRDGPAGDTMQETRWKESPDGQSPPDRGGREQSIERKLPDVRNVSVLYLL